MQIIEHRAYARAGFIGNPSDGYGGKTIAFTLRNYFAKVVMYPWDQLEVLPAATDKTRFESLSDLVESIGLNGYYGGVRLVKATIKRFADYCEQEGHSLSDQPFSMRYETNVPRGVGLSGSSAIITATLRCLMEFFDVSIPIHIQPSLVRSVENDELGIACGYQDRVVQVYEGLVYMDFGSMQPAFGLEYGDYARVDSSQLPPVYLAFDLSHAKTSGSVHGPLRARVADNEELQRTIAEIASLVPPARSAIESGDADELHALIDHNFDLRRRLYNIKPAHLAMIETARSVGASAKFAGSGGSIVGTFHDDAMFANLEAAMQARDASWCVLRPKIAASSPG